MAAGFQCAVDSILLTYLAAPSFAKTCRSRYWRTMSANLYSVLPQSEPFCSEIVADSPKRLLFFVFPRHLEQLHFTFEKNLIEISIVLSKESLVIVE